MDMTMNPIFPVTALQKRQAEVKRAAQDSVVRITENGVGAYVFCSESVFEKALAEAAEAAAYEERVSLAVERGRQDYAEGRVVHGIEKAREAIEARRHG